MNIEHVVKAAGAVHSVIRVNPINLEILFYGRPATYWPGRSVVLRNPIDGKFLKLKSK
jgi:hypothetical protein